MPTLAITKENAAEYARQGAVKRVENRKALLAQAALVPELQRRIIELTKEPPKLQADEGYIATTITRLRERTSTLLDQIAKEQDPQELQRLATAFDKLSEVEQKLSMRPLPGSLRPTKQAKARSSVIADPIE